MCAIVVNLFCYGYSFVCARSQFIRFWRTSQQTITRVHHLNCCLLTDSRAKKDVRPFHTAHWLHTLATNTIRSHIQFHMSNWSALMAHSKVSLGHTYMLLEMCRDMRHHSNYVQLFISRTWFRGHLAINNEMNINHPSTIFPFVSLSLYALSIDKQIPCNCCVIVCLPVS